MSIGNFAVQATESLGAASKHDVKGAYGARLSSFKINKQLSPSSYMKQSEMAMLRSHIRTVKKTMLQKSFKRWLKSFKAHP